VPDSARSPGTEESGRRVKLALLSLLWFFQGAQADSKGVSVKVFRNLSYKAGSKNPAQRLDLYVPSTTDARTPVLVMVHGGAWISGSKEGYEPLARNFAAEGIVAVVPEYRLSPQVKYPSHNEDVRDAIEWVVSQAGKYGFSQDRMAMLGHSAGAHVAACLAADPGDLPKNVPSAFIALSGIYDLPALDKKWPGYDKWFLEKAFGARGGWKTASPKFSKLKNHAKWLVIHGEADELVDTAQSSEFASVLKAQGISQELKIEKGLDHFGVLRDLGAARNPLTAAILAFLKP